MSRHYTEDQKKTRYETQRRWIERQPKDYASRYMSKEEYADYARLLRLAFGRHRVTAKARLEKIRGTPKHEEILAKGREYHARNKERIRENKLIWRQSNRERICQNQRRYRETNINARLKNNIASRLRNLLKRDKGLKSAATVRLVGCEMSFLKDYLQARFLDGMSWNNYGSVWQIDHIIPCAEFDMTDVEQQRQCFHYSNLQPLGARENRIKNAKCPTRVQFELL